MPGSTHCPLGRVLGQKEKIIEAVVRAMEEDGKDVGDKAK